MTESDPNRVGSYRLLRLLGRGGMAEVWEAAHDERPATRVAIKTLPLSIDTASSSRQRLLDEAQLGVTLAHPNLVQTLDVVFERERAAVVLELLEGMTLSELLTTGAPPPLGFTLGVWLQILSGLSYLHQARDAEGKPLELVHRDLKPSNLFITREGLAKIIDLGIALLQDSERTLTRTGTFRGSLPYCSPETLRHERLDQQSDLFSLGLVIHELLTGQRCYNQSSEAAVMSAVLWSPTPPVRQLRPEVPVWMEEVLAALLNKEKSARPVSALAVSERLRAHSETLPPFTEQQIAQWLLGRKSRRDTNVSTASGVELPAPLLVPAVATTARATPGSVSPPVAPAPARGRWSRPLGAAALLGVVLLGVAGLWFFKQAPPEPGPPPVASEPLTQIPPESAQAKVPDARPAESPKVPVVTAPSSPVQRAPRPQRKTARKPPAEQGEGFLTVGTAVGWANVEVDGKPVGPTPLFRFAVASGQHSVVVIRRDGVRQKHTVVIQNGQERRLSIVWPSSATEP